MILGTQDKDFFPSDLKEKFLFLKEKGFDCFEIDGKLLLEHRKELPEIIRETGMYVCSGCNGYRGWIGDIDEERRQAGLADLKEMLAALAEIGAEGMFIHAAYVMCTTRLPGRQSPRSKEEDRRILLDSLSQLDVVARKKGVYLFLEPLNSFADHMINTVETAVSLIEEGGFTNVKVTCDFYHLAMEEDELSATFRKYGKYIGRVHLCENPRLQPGTGSIDFKKHMATLKEVGYDGPAVIECMVRVNPGDASPLDAFLKSVPYMKQFM